MALQQTIPQVPPLAIASYDYTDIASGTGIVKFFLFDSENSVSKDYHLGREVIYSRDINVTFGAGLPATGDRSGGGRIYFVWILYNACLYHRSGCDRIYV